MRRLGRDVRVLFSFTFKLAQELRTSAQTIKNAYYCITSCINLNLYPKNQFTRNKVKINWGHGHPYGFWPSKNLYSLRSWHFLPTWIRSNYLRGIGLVDLSSIHVTVAMAGERILFPWLPTGLLQLQKILRTVDPIFSIFNSNIECYRERIVLQVGDSRERQTEGQDGQKKSTVFPSWRLPSNYDYSYRKCEIRHQTQIYIGRNRRTHNFFLAKKERREAVSMELWGCVKRTRHDTSEDEETMKESEKEGRRQYII